jgi:hypothetical protein
MLFISVTLDVSQLLTEGLNTALEHILNILFIVVTLDVFSLSAFSKSVMLEHPLNHPAQLIGAIA